MTNAPIDVYRANATQDKGYKATAAVTKNRAVKLATGASQTVSPIAAAADPVFGFALNTLDATGQGQGFGVLVARSGITVVEAGVAVAVGDSIVIDSAGRGVPVGTASAGTTVLGTALGAASASGKLFAMQISNLN